MLNDAARRDVYRAQTGREELTPRQRPRADHKLNHQSMRAADAREVRAKEKAARHEERARSRLLLPSKAT